MMPDYNLIKDKKNIVLSTENIDPSLVPKMPGINLILLEPDQIQEKANNEGDFLYLHFKWLKIEDSILTAHILSMEAVRIDFFSACIRRTGLADTHAF